LLAVSAPFNHRSGARFGFGNAASFAPHLSRASASIAAKARPLVGGSPQVCVCVRLGSKNHNRTRNGRTFTRLARARSLTMDGIAVRYSPAPAAGPS
jgi:hypothetical protein